MSQHLKPNEEKLRETIQHIVVLMLENRSFDNLLGWLYDDERPPRDQEFEGLNWDLWNPLSNIDADGNRFTEKVGVRQNGKEYKLGRKWMQSEPDFSLPSPDPGEGFKDTNYQLYGTYDVDSLYPPEPLAQGFVDNYLNAMLYGTYSFQDTPTDPREIMTCYTRDQTPVLSTLAKQFAVCDQWYCSVPSQTLLVITYDEHGGCYDHYPPTATAKTPDEASAPGQFGFRFNRFGVRVPAVIVSPLIEAGTIARPSGYVPFDHTSVIKTARNCFRLKGSLTARDAEAPDLSCVLTLDSPRTDKPQVKPLRYEVEDKGKVNDLHRLAADMLSKITGKERPSDEQIHEFIHSAYQQAFS